MTGTLTVLHERDEVTVTPGEIDKARRSTLSKPVVRSAAGRRMLVASLRRLGADERTVAKLTAEVRPTTG